MRLKSVRCLTFLLLLFLSVQSFAQYMHIYGTVQDTTYNIPLPNAVAITVRLNDSLLTSFTRSDKDGKFSLDSVPIDTYQVIISHPRFGDQTFILIGGKDNTDFD